MNNTEKYIEKKLSGTMYEAIGSDDIIALLEAVRDMTVTLRLVAFGKSEGPYSAMHRIRAARGTLKVIEAKFGKLLLE